MKLLQVLSWRVASRCGWGLPPLLLLCWFSIGCAAQSRRSLSPAVPEPATERENVEEARTAPTQPRRAPTSSAPALKRSKGELRDTLRELTDRAQTQLVELAAASSRDAGVPAGDALDTVAAMIEAISASAANQERLESIRFQAERLRRSDGAWFGRAGWIQEALLATLDALDDLQPCGEELEPWASAARESAAKISKRGAISFERAAIQDAFRATVDTFSIIAFVEQICTLESKQVGGVT
jgi:hypothetical protein